MLGKHAPEIAAGLPPSRDLETVIAGVEERRGNVSEAWDWLMADGRHGLAVDEAAAWFEDAELATMVIDLEQTADEAQAFFRTTSMYFQIEPERREAFEADDRAVIERFGGTVKFALASVLVTAARRAAPTSTSAVRRGGRGEDPPRAENEERRRDEQREVGRSGRPPAKCV